MWTAMAETGRMPRLIWVFTGRTVTLWVLSWDGSFYLFPCFTFSMLFAFYRGRLQHGRHFTFMSATNDSAITLVSPSVNGSIADERHPFAAHGLWLQVLLAEDFIEEMCLDLDELDNPEEVQTVVNHIFLYFLIRASSGDYGTFRPQYTHSSNAHAQPSSGARCLIFGWTLHSLPYFMCANSEGSGETGSMHRLAWAFAGRLIDKYHNLMSWLIHIFSYFLFLKCRTYHLEDLKTYSVL